MSFLFGDIHYTFVGQNPKKEGHPGAVLKILTYTQGLQCSSYLGRLWFFGKGL